MQLDAQQTAAVRDTRSKEKLIIAGAGSGKTTTLTEAITAYSGQLDLTKAVAITFTVAGAEVLKQRLEKKGVKLWYIGTLQGFCMHLINKKALAIGMRAPVQIVDEETETEWIKREREALRLKSVTLEEVRNAKANPSMSKAGIVAKAYLMGLLRENAVDFDTMLLKGADIIALCEMSALFVDEYQDTGPLDQKFYDACNAQVKVYVGDPDQAIYPFRGASVEFILETAKRATVYFLENNYRSGSGIVAAANRLIAHNKQRVAKVMNAALPEKGEGRIWKNETIADECARIIAFLKEEPGSEIAILARYNSTVDLLANFLRTSGINVRVRKSETEEWKKEAVAALNVMRAIRTPFASLSESATEAWWRGKADSCELAIRDMEQRTGRTANSMSEGELFASLRLRPAAANALRKAYVEGSFDESLARLLKNDAEETGNGNVLISTIHGVKGMEFDNVVIASVCEECMPGSNNIEEERRLFYVAMTRAKKRLFVSCVARWNQPFSNAIINATESRFIVDLQS